MSSLSLSILLLAVLVALGIAAQSLWVLLREKKRSPLVKQPPPPAQPASAPIPEDAEAAASHAAGPGEPRLSPDDLTDLPASTEPKSSVAFEMLPQDDEPKAAANEVASPVLDAVNHGEAEAIAVSKAAIRPAAEAPGPAASQGMDKPAMPPGQRVLHDEADCLVEIPLLQITSGDKLLGLTKSIRRAGGKPVAFEGLPHMPEASVGVQLALPTGGEEEAPAEPAREPQWEALRHGVSYRRLRAGILLSNRQGPLNSVEYEEFGSKLKGLASQLGVPVDMPESMATLQRAKSLDNLLADCDVQLGLAVDCTHALTPSDLAALAKRLNLFERGNNRYACLGEAGDVIYTVALGEKAQRLQMMFDVPRVLPAHMPWWKMAEAAHQAALQFEGRIIDDSGRELSEKSFRNVAIALEGRQQALAEAGVPAGSALAMRVFN